jgi:hypothetical protein
MASITLRGTSLMLILLIAFFSCRKEESSSVSKISNPTMPTHIIGDSTCTFDSSLYSMGSVLTSTQMNEYFEIWKSLFMVKNGLDNNTFARYVIKTEKSSNKWREGISFRVDYLIKIDWAIVGCFDELFVYKDSSGTTYNYLNIPKNVFLNKSQIEFNLSHEVYSEISRYNLFKPLAFKNCEEACMAARQQSGYHYLFTHGLSFYVPGMVPRENGDLYLSLYGDIDRSANQCLTGNINIMDGQSHITESPCRIY